MCTAITFHARDFYFGRTLDLETSYHGEVTVTPRNFPLMFRYARPMFHHHAIIGMARVEQGYPLYFDAVNEHGLCMAGLELVGWTRYDCGGGTDRVCHFELIPWVLGQCKTVTQARALLGRLHLTDDAFSPAYPVSELHWIVADPSHVLTVEATAEGLKVYDNPVGVLTNSPPFDRMLYSLNRYLNLTPQEPENRFSSLLNLQPDSHGMGAIGLPGDLSSPSRFVRAAFTRLNAVTGETEEENVGQFFHILDTVTQTKGCSHTAEGAFETTVYASCCNASRGIYYYTTYDNRQITGVELHREDLEGRELTAYPRIEQQQIRIQN